MRACGPHKPQHAGAFVCLLTSLLSSKLLFKTDSTNILRKWRNEDREIAPANVRIYPHLAWNDMSWPHSST